MSNILLYFVGPLAGVLIFVIGVLVSLITGSTIEFVAILGIAFGIALMTEFCVVFSLVEEAS